MGWVALVAVAVWFQVKSPAIPLLHHSFAKKQRPLFTHIPQTSAVTRLDLRCLAAKPNDPTTSKAHQPEHHSRL